MKPSMRLPVIALGLLGAAGCAQDDTRASVGDSTLAVSVVGGAAFDTPGREGIRAAVITVDRAYLVGGEHGSVTVSDGPVTLDLVDLNAATSVWTREMAALDAASELRLVVSGAYIDVQGAGIFATPGYTTVPVGAAVAGELRTPSADTSGLKVMLPDAAFGAGAVLHFDIAESFAHAAGASGAWIMHPTIDAVAIGDTGRLVIRAVPAANAVLTPGARLAVRVYDSADNAEAEAELTLATDGRLEADFPNLVPSEGPFRAEVLTANQHFVATVPPLPTSITLGPGADLDFDVELALP